MTLKEDIEAGIMHLDKVGRLIGMCNYCSKIVWVNKPIFGDFHFCVSSMEQKMIDHSERRESERRIKKLMGENNDN